MNNIKFFINISRSLLVLFLFLSSVVLFVFYIKKYKHKRWIKPMCFILPCVMTILVSVNIIFGRNTNIVINDLNSLAVLLLLAFFIALCVCAVYCFIKQIKSGGKWLIRLISVVLIVTTTALMFQIFASYMYPFQQNAEYTLYAVVDIPEEKALSRTPTVAWHAAYTQYGVYAESKFFNPDRKNSVLGFTWPEMDFDNHTYIIVYAHKLEELTYNVWDTVDYPIRTGAKIGEAKLSEEFEPTKVYIYELKKKIRVENNI